MSDETTNDQAAQANQAGGRHFDIEKIYLKDVSFETANTPQVFLEDWQPETAVQLRTAVNRVSDDRYEVVLSLTVTAKQGESTAYLVEVHQAGIFAIAGYSQEELDPLLGAYCPSTLYPFARQAIADLVWKGGFKQLLLGPINFDALYEDRQRRKAAQQQAEPS